MPLLTNQQNLQKPLLTLLQVPKIMEVNIKQGYRQRIGPHTFRPMPMEKHLQNLQKVLL